MPADLNGYQLAATRTERSSYPDLNVVQSRFAVLSLGLVGEAGEFADTIKKVVGHGHAYDEAMEKQLAEELGDVLWYVACLADAMGYLLSDIATMNTNKLTARYRDGFSTDASVNRTA